jgi:transposase InsO family protein
MPLTVRRAASFADSMIAMSTLGANLVAYPSASDGPHQPRRWIRAGPADWLIRGCRQQGIPDHSSHDLPRGGAGLAMARAALHELQRQRGRLRGRTTHRARGRAARLAIGCSASGSTASLAAGKAPGGVHLRLVTRRVLRNAPGRGAPIGLRQTRDAPLLHRAVWPTRQHARTAIFRYIEAFYNRRRRHSGLGFRSPAQFEADTSAATLSA